VAEVDAHTGLLPGPFTTRVVEELFIDGTVPKKRDDSRRGVAIDRASGLRWQDGCAGPRIVRGVLDLSNVESDYPTWQKYNRGWMSRAASGPYVRGGPENTRTSYFYDGAFQPFGPGWGGGFVPSRTCSPAPPPPAPCDPLLGPCESPPPTTPPGQPVDPKPSKPPKPRRRRLATGDEPVTACRHARGSGPRHAGR
jgi:hypothetical protein